VGVDLGTRDGTAIVVWAWSPTHPGLWEVYSEVRRTPKGDRFPLGTLVAWFREVEAAYGPFTEGVADDGGLATMVLDTLANEHFIYLSAAEKREKVDHIALFNKDLDAGLVHIREHSDLSVELQLDRWDMKKLALGKREEDRSVPNDTADAALYSWRACQHRRAKERQAAPSVGSADWWRARELAELEAAKARAKARVSGEHDYSRMDLPWWEGN
jgi:hypothetical protein